MKDAKELRKRLIHESEERAVKQQIHKTWDLGYMVLTQLPISTFEKCIAQVNGGNFTVEKLSHFFGFLWSCQFVPTYRNVEKLKHAQNAVKAIQKLKACISKPIHYALYEYEDFDQDKISRLRYRLEDYYESLMQAIQTINENIRSDEHRGIPTAKKKSKLKSTLLMEQVALRAIRIFGRPLRHQFVLDVLNTQEMRKHTRLSEDIDPDFFKKISSKLK